MILENLLVKIHNVKLHVLFKGHFKPHIESTHNTTNKKEINVFLK